MRISVSEGQYNVEQTQHERKALNSAFMLTIIAAVLLTFGLTMLYSTSYSTVGLKYFKAQLIWSGVGLAAGTTVFCIGYRRLSQFIWPIIILTAALLVIALFFPAVKGAHRWIRLPGMSIQPSEFAKITIVLFLSKYCAENLRTINSWSFRHGLLLPICVCGLLLGLILVGKDLGTTVLCATVCGLMLFVAGLRARWVIGAMVVAPTVIFFLVKFFSPVRWARLTTFLNPEVDRSGDGYQLWNSLLALGSGNWTGVGFMASRLKGKYLPEAHTDFILAIIGEELGYISILLVLAAYILFAYYGLRISLNAYTRQGMLLGFGVTMMITIQAFINMGVVSGAFPTKGMPAPFLSYGGSSLLSVFIATGLLLNVAAERVYPQINDVIVEKFLKLLHLRGK